MPVAGGSRVGTKRMVRSSLNVGRIGQCKPNHACVIVVNRQCPSRLMCLSLLRILLSIASVNTTKLADIFFPFQALSMHTFVWSIQSCGIVIIAPILAYLHQIAHKRHRQWAILAQHLNEPSARNAKRPRGRFSLIA